MKPNLPKLSLCFICRNGDKKELETIPKMLDSVLPYVDEVCATVTIKQGEKIAIATDKMLQSKGCKVSVFETKGVDVKGFWWISNFAEARNFNFEQASNELVLWLDSDDELVNGDKLKDCLANFVDRPTTAVFFDYQYGFDEDGNCVNVHPRERIVRKSMHKWTGRLHENAMCQFKPFIVKSPDVYVKHNVTVEEIQYKAFRNLAIIEAAYLEQVEANDVDPRTLYDLGRSYAAMGFNVDDQGVEFNEKAIGAFVKFLEVSKSEEDRYDANCRMADIYLIKGMMKDAKQRAYTAIDINPQYPEAYLKLAKVAFIEKDYDHCLHWIHVFENDGQGNPRKSAEKLARDPIAMTVQPMMLAAESYYHTNKPELAHKVVKQVIKLVPSNKDVKAFLDKVEQFLNLKTATKGCLVTLDVLKMEGNEDKIKAFSEAVPDMVKQHRTFVELKQKYNPIDGKNRLVIFCERSFEYWSPESIKTGIGGSEEMVIQMAKGLQKQGWNVEVYNKIQEPGEWDGVKYKPYDMYSPILPCEVFISWRYPEYIALAPENSLKILWCHDVQSIDNYNKQILDRIDKIFVLSEYHRENLPDIPNEKFYVTRNAIDPEQFGDRGDCLRSLDHDLNQYIYGSSPDRGLIFILENWDKILEINPHAHLNIFYGFNAVFEYFSRGNDPRGDLKRHILDLCEKYKESITFHGKVGHYELAEWFMKCGFWLYPTNFPEISCMTAMKAQAAGCWPVCNDYAALAETVQHGTITKGIMPENLGAWLDSAHRASAEATPEARAKMREWALEFFSIHTLAQNWSERFKEWIQTKQENIENEKKQAV